MACEPRAGYLDLGVSFVCFHTVARWIRNRLAIDRTLSPLARAVRIGSTSFVVSGVRERLVGFETTPGSGSDTAGCSLAMPRLACSHVEISCSSRRWVFGLGPASSTKIFVGLSTMLRCVTWIVTGHAPRGTLSPIPIFRPLLPPTSFGESGGRWRRRVAGQGDRNLAFGERGKGEGNEPDPRAEDPVTAGTRVGG